MEDELKASLRIADLMARYLSAKLTPAEAEELSVWITAREENRQLFNSIVNVPALEESIPSLQRFDATKAAAGKEPAGPGKISILKRKWLRVAAALALLISGGAALTLLLQRHKETPVIALHKTDIAPGQARAVLTLVGGRTVVLNSGLDGNIAREGGASVNVNKNAITYTASNADIPPAYNTLTTGKGELSPYPLVLSDGTRVWLNNASSVTFPTVFSGNERRVTITGEAYLEIAHNDRIPFRIVAGTQVIEDVGTRFNVNCYPDEAVIKTTLLEGAVRIRTAQGEAGTGTLLKPGQQAVMNNETGDIKVNTVNTQQAIAWKEGMFRFNDEDLATIMRMVSRWYNVQVEFSDPALKNLRFGAVANRFANVSTLLHMLELTDEVKFRVEQDKITVLAAK